MSQARPVELTELAARQIREAEAWWRANRTLAPHAVRQQLERAFALLAVQPRIGSRADNVTLSGVRRIFLPIIKQYLYYQILDSPDRVQVIALWHARRGDGPPV
ncbi:MAG TPA: type II toxin-antitoxin system RelE/ParE family toxin [Thermoanaerobaculia bacterium]|nr:type II toxin-antitoxin system RelE/ParE family toxin [Thermoanaerobaculia bacterium]